jgi:hypothetical protein
MRIWTLTGLLLLLATPAAADEAVGGGADAPEAAAAGSAEATDAKPEEGAGGQTAAAAGQPFDFMSDGSRIVVEGRGFSIRPPKGWEVHTKHPTLSLLLQIPFKSGLRYRRTIQIASFNGVRYMDELTAKEFEGLIVKKFSGASGSIENFRIRNHMNVELADGRPGLLFYTEMVIDGVDLMQAHILVSSTERHYLMTYTDVREHFEDDAAAGQFLTEAWDAMVSVELDGRTPQRFESMKQIGIGAGAMLLFLTFLWGVRQWRARRALAAYADGSGGDADDSSSKVDSGFGGSSDVRTLDEKRASKKAKSKYKVETRNEPSLPPSSLDKSKLTRSGMSALTAASQLSVQQKSREPSVATSDAGLTGFTRFDDEDKAV